MNQFPLPEKVITNLIKKAFGIDRYSFIIQELIKKDISNDKNYQKNFNAFYVVRRNATWRKIYYDYFELNKLNKHLTFEMILRYLYEKTGKVESSFSSKLLSTINPHMPIWDSYVLKNLGFDMKLGKKVDKLETAIKLYGDINETYLRLVQSQWGKSVIEKFDQALQDYIWISDIKKIDFFIWQMR